MKKKELLLLLTILAIAAFFRLWKLDLIPPGLYPDEAINANEAIGAPGKIFYRENNGREGLFINLIALSFSIFGISIWAFKIVPAIIGILTCLGLYLLTKELFSFKNLTIQQSNNPIIIALLSAFFLATSFWHINFSRIGFRAILTPFILVFAFYLLFRGFRRKKTLDFIASGILLGLGFYTYISYRFVVLLLLIVLINWWLFYKKKKLEKQFLLFTVYCLLSIVVIALPIGMYFLKNPQDFMGRASPISIFAAENPIKEFGKSLILHLGMFNFYGDSNWRHNFSTSPMLLWPIGILFLIGLFLSIKDLITSIKNKNCALYIVHCLLITWLFVFLLPGILTWEGVPHSLRVIGVIPVVYIFAALGGNHVYNWLNNKIQNKILFIVYCFFFIVLLSVQFNKYFFSWGQSLEVQNAFAKDYVEFGNFLNSLEPEIQIYVIVNQSGVPVPWPDGIPVAAQTPMFIEWTKSPKTKKETPTFFFPATYYLLPKDINKVKIDNRKTVIAPMTYDEALFNDLRERFPQGETKQENNIWIYKINF